MNFRRKGLTNLEIHLKGTLMSKNKIALSLAVAGILGASSALAETDGVFFGVQIGVAQANAKKETVIVATNPNTNISASGNDSYADDRMGVRFGISLGYNQFFTHKFGLRYYGVIDFGDYDELDVYNFNANIDALYNFYSQDEMQAYIFGGAYLGYSNYDQLSLSGADAGVNLGLQFKLQEHHNIDLYSRFSVVKLTKTISDSDTMLGAQYTEKSEITLSQPYQVGLRYTYSF